ncbi:effector binding domain-containing protein [Paenibacillus sp. MBLB4367]|uniref:effector binding domain-containing protein n=1 Tax=Paenibacillus sp. MBLB4367 TaxID=3384767 RepID=UPI00390821C5
MTKAVPSIKLVSKDSFTVIGLSCVTSKANARKNNTIGKLFSSFANRSAELRNPVSRHMHGVSIYPEDFSGFQNYEFIAGYLVNAADEIPEGMTARTFPAHQYAVVTHKGSIKSLADSYGYFHSTWLPASGYKYASRYDVQVYDSRFLGPDHPDSELAIHIPVRPSQEAAVVQPVSPIRREIQGVFIPVRNIQAAKSWYSSILGLPDSGQAVNGHLYVLPVDGPDLILDEMPLWGGREPGGPPAYQTPAVILPTHDINEAYRFMKEQGVELLTEIMDAHWFVFLDPDGNKLMVRECSS